MKTKRKKVTLSCAHIVFRILCVICVVLPGVGAWGGQTPKGFYLGTQHSPGTQGESQ